MRVLLTLALVLDFFIFHCSGYRGLEVRPEDLYEGAANEDVLDCLRRSINNNNDAKSCENVDQDGRNIIDDNLCRYYSTYFLKVNGRLRKRSRDCSCCGHFYQYIEQGKICTRYCAGRGRESEELDPLIRLPFNWGDECPEEIFLGDKKTPVPDKLKECEDLMEDYYDEETEELENHQGDRVVKPQQPTRTTTTMNNFKTTTAKLEETSRTTTTTPTRTPTRAPTRTSTKRADSSTTTTTTVKKTPRTTTQETTRTTTRTTTIAPARTANKRQDSSNLTFNRQPDITNQTSTIFPRPTTTKDTVIWGRNRNKKKSQGSTNERTSSESVHFGIEIRPRTSASNLRKRRRGKHKNRRRNRPQTPDRKVSDPNKPTTTSRKRTSENLQLSDIDGKPIWG